MISTSTFCTSMAHAWNSARFAYMSVSRSMPCAPKPSLITPCSNAAKLRCHLVAGRHQALCTLVGLLLCIHLLMNHCTIHNCTLSLDEPWLSQHSTCAGQNTPRRCHPWPPCSAWRASDCLPAAASCCACFCCHACASTPWTLTCSYGGSSCCASGYHPTRHCWSRCRLQPLLAWPAPGASVH